VLHHDVKPANILLTTDGRPMLTDFGISAIADTEAIAYSFAYAPPETFRGGVNQRDERSDLYSLARHPLQRGRRSVALRLARRCCRRLTARLPGKDCRATGPVDLLVATVDDPTLDDVATDPIVPSYDEVVWALDVADDGRIVSAGADTAIFAWDPDDPEAEALTFRQHDDSVESVAVLSDGRVASGAANGRIWVWDLAGQPGRTVGLGPVSSSVWSVAAMADGLFVSGTDDGSVRVWDPERTEAEQLVLTGHDGAVRSVAVLPDGRWCRVRPTAPSRSGRQPASRFLGRWVFGCARCRWGRARLGSCRCL
jgi:hypothetical protein